MQDNSKDTKFRVVKENEETTNDPTWEMNRDSLSDIPPEKVEELCKGVTTPSEVEKFLGKSREPILEGALINVHHHLACEPVPGKPHQILITDHHLWHDYIDFFAGSKPNQTKSRVNRNKSFSSRWFKMPPGRKPKSFIIETYPARRKDVERKLAIVRSKVGDKENPKKIKIGDSVKVFTPPNPNQLLLLLSQRKISMSKKKSKNNNDSGGGIKSKGKKRPRRSSRFTDNNKNDTSEEFFDDDEDYDDEEDEAEEEDDEEDEQDSSESSDNTIKRNGSVRNTHMNHGTQVPITPPKKRLKAEIAKNSTSSTLSTSNHHISVKTVKNKEEFSSSVTLMASSSRDKVCDSNNNSDTTMSELVMMPESATLNDVEQDGYASNDDIDLNQGTFLLNFLRSSV
eukprot:TRINITY_DN1690_c0_g1_i1.p1 TRINITY_DN1690_c0_g1~~TRINITY_DN1690_c0_g1_i1.p1  ORF type:complete len:398 (-),score=76.07 TRINITY_DN1690_c0_g1_i1:123-1316(-)